MRTLQEIKESFQKAPDRAAKLVADERARKVKALNDARAKLPGTKDNEQKATQGEISRLEARIAQIDAATKEREARAKDAKAVQEKQAAKAAEKIAEIRATQDGYAEAFGQYRAKAEAKADAMRAKLAPSSDKAPEPPPDPVEEAQPEAPGVGVELR